MSPGSEGKRWSAAQLGRLREERFAPRAWWRFIAASLGRAARTRAGRPALARQARSWCWTGTVAGAALLASRPRLRRHAPSFAAWWLALAFMLDWHLGMVEGHAGELRERLGAADALTLVRLWLVPVLATAEDPLAHAALVLAAALTDVADGPLARRAGPTRLGRDLDHSADVAIMLASAFSARRGGWLGPAATRLLVARAVLPAVAVAWVYFRCGVAPAQEDFPSLRALTPALVTGLAICPAFPPAGNALVAGAAGGALTGGVIALSRRGRDPRRRAQRWL